MSQTIISPEPSALASLANRFADEYHAYHKRTLQVEREHKKAQRALEKELYALTGLKPKDKVLYKGEQYVVEDVYMPYLAADESERSKVYVTMHKPRCSYRCLKALFGEKEEIIKQ